MNDINIITEAFRKEFQRRKNTAKAKREKTYLKSDDDFYGVSYWEIDIIIKEFRKKNPTLEKDKLFRLTKILWNSNFHEEKTLAIKLLNSYHSYLSYKDMTLLEDMLVASKGWDHIDEISCHLVYAILMKNKKAFNYLKKWSESSSFWMRRASLISQILLFRQGKGDKELFFSMAQNLLSEKEFFIRKAIGWTLRELSKSDPQSVVNFLNKNKEKLSGLSFREGSRKLPKEFKRQFLTG